MTGNDWLRDELMRLEQSAPPPGGPPKAPRAQIGWRTSILIGTAATAVVITFVALDAMRSPDTLGAAPSPPGGVTATSRNGVFELTISSPQSVWRASDGIELSARLAYDGDSDDVTLASGARLIVFRLQQTSGGSASYDSTSGFMVCGISHLGPDDPIAGTFEKLGQGDDPPFGAAFQSDPELHLPPGTWEVTAATSFLLGDCGAGHENASLEATIDILVTAESTEATEAARPTPLHSPADGAPSPNVMCGDIGESVCDQIAAAVKAVLPVAEEVTAVTLGSFVCLEVAALRAAMRNVRWA